MKATPQPTSVTGNIAAIVPAAGRGQRYGGARNKLFTDLAGRPIWVHVVEKLARRAEIGRLLMPVARADRSLFANEFAGWVDAFEIELVEGGAERVDSVRAGLAALVGDDAIEYVAVHDAARPLVMDTDLDAVFRAARVSGAAILATPVVGTLKRRRSRQPHHVTEPGPAELDPGSVALAQACVTTVDRTDLWVAQTPQVFRRDWLQAAYERFRGWPVTDDAQLVERSGYPVELVQGRPDNLKITHPEDLAIAAAILAQHSQHFS